MEVKSKWREARERAMDALKITSNLEQNILFDSNKLKMVLDEINIERTVQPPSILTDLSIIWKELKEGIRTEINRRHLRGMFWIPDIALTKEFQEYIKNRNIKFRRGSTKGFVSSLLLQW